MAIDKFIQAPDLTPAGIDVLCVGYPPQYRKLADDWVCEVTGEVTKISFWISFLNDNVVTPDSIHLSIHLDIPEGPGGWSIPGPLLWMRDFVPAEFAISLESSGVVEQFVDPVSGTVGTDTQVWRVDCFVPQGERFFQEAGNIYWLDVVIDTTSSQWAPVGWKTSPDMMAPDFAVWTDNPDPEPAEPDWLLLTLPPAGAPTSLSFVIETEPHVTTTTRPPTTEPQTTTRPPTTTPEPPVTKWEQLPDETPDGIDIRSDFFSETNVVADDWPCTQRGRLTRIWLWCSFYDDAVPTPPFAGLTLRIYDDVPSGPYGHSCPGAPLWEHVFTPGVDCSLEPYMPTTGEWFWGPGPDGPQAAFPGDTLIFRVDCDLLAAGVPEFIQEGSSGQPLVYWLSAHALIGEPGIMFGWKTSTMHWNDAACFAWRPDGAIPAPPEWSALAYPPTHQLEGSPIDMAFGIEHSPLPDAPTTTTAPATTTTAPGTTTGPGTTTAPGTTTGPGTTTAPGTTTGPGTTTAPGTTTGPPYTTPPPGPDTTPHPADTGPGVSNWRISSTEILSYAAAWLSDDDSRFPGIPPANRSAYVLRGAATFLANFQARYHDVGTAHPWGSPEHAARWQELPDL